MVDKFSFRKGYRGRSIFRVLNVIFLSIVMLLMIIPVLKVIADSFDAATNYSLNIFPTQLTLEAYQTIISNVDLYRPFLISLLTTVLGTAIGLILVTLGGYVVLHRDMPGNKFFTWMIFITMVFNGGMIPTYLVIRDLHLLDTLWAVVLPLAINVYDLLLMRSFFEGIPVSLMEASEIDGCTPIGTFFRIVLPLSMPALASIGLFFLVEFWNVYVPFVLYIAKDQLQNFQVKLRDIILSGTNMNNALTSGVSQKTLENACVVVSMLPPMIIYPFCQKYFVKGVTLGAVKE
jgi:putative aldouronate transport system permease protein